MKAGRFNDEARALVREAFEALNARGPEDQDEPAEDVEMQQRQHEAAVAAARRVRFLLGGPERHLELGRAHSRIIDSSMSRERIAPETARAFARKVRESGLADSDPTLAGMIRAFDESKVKRDKGKFAKQEGAGAEEKPQQQGLPGMDDSWLEPNMDGQLEKRTQGRLEFGAVQRTGGEHGLDEETRQRRRASDDAARRAERGFSDNTQFGDLGRPLNEDGEPMSGVEMIAQVAGPDTGKDLPEGFDTQQFLRDEDGNYTPERQELHAKIVASVFEGKKPVPEGTQPIFHMMGGGPAAGKSGVLKHGLSSTPEGAVTIDPDQAKLGLPEMHDLMGARDSRAASFVHEESSDVRKVAQNKALSERYHTVLDATGDSSFEKLKATIDQARAAGHRIHADYVSIPTDEAVKRSAKRAAENPDRSVVPEDVIRGTHRGVSEVFPQALEAGLYDEVKLWDNMVPKGQPPRLILEHKDGKTVVHDEAAWQDFKNKSLEPDPWAKD